jgi:hypothetical protein
MGRLIDLDDPAVPERFLAEDPDSPVTMLNLLRFRPDGGACRTRLPSSGSTSAHGGSRDGSRWVLLHRQAEEGRDRGP